MKLFGAVFLFSIIPSCLSLPENNENVAARTISQIPSSLPTIDPSWRHNRTRQRKHIHDFFQLFGWIRHNESIPDDALPAAIRKVQKVLREPETGVYDERMETVMSRPRCGTIQPYNETDAAISNGTMHKRFVLWGPKWDHTTITYRFVNYTTDLTSERQRSIVRSANISHCQSSC